MEGILAASWQNPNYSSQVSKASQNSLNDKLTYIYSCDRR